MTMKIGKGTATDDDIMIKRKRLGQKITDIWIWLALETL